MLADMKIPADSGMVSDAAKLLGSKDGDITFDVFKKAEIILDPTTITISQHGKVPQLEALLGPINISGQLARCSGVTEDFYDNIIVQMGPKTEVPSISVSKQQEAFNQKQDNLFRQMFNILWWENIWPRVVLLLVNTIKNTVALPIDSLFCLIRFKKPSQSNRDKYGPISKVLNWLTILLLCKVPISATKGNESYTYKAPSDVMVYYKPKNKTMSVKTICFEETCPECVKSSLDSSVDDSDLIGDDDKSKTIRNNVQSATNSTQSQDKPPCEFIDDFKSDAAITGPGVAMNCFDAAQIVMNYVTDKALNDSGYTINDSTVDKLIKENATKGKVQGSMNA